MQQSKYVEMLTSGQMDNTLTIKRKADRLRHTEAEEKQ